MIQALLHSCGIQACCTGQMRDSSCRVWVCGPVALVLALVLVGSKQSSSLQPCLQLDMPPGLHFLPLARPCTFPCQFLSLGSLSAFLYQRGTTFGSLHAGLVSYGSLLTLVDTFPFPRCPLGMSPSSRALLGTGSSSHFLRLTSFICVG